MGATRPGRGVCRLLSTSRRDGRGRGRHHTAVSRAGAQGGRGVAAPPGWRDSLGATPRLRVADTERLPAAAPALVTLKTEVRSHGQPPPRGARPGLQGMRALVPSAGHTLPAPPRRLPGTRAPTPSAGHTPPAPPRRLPGTHTARAPTLQLPGSCPFVRKDTWSRARSLVWRAGVAGARATALLLGAQQRVLPSASRVQRPEPAPCPPARLLCARAPEASLAGCALLRHDDLSRAVVVDRQTRAVGLLG